LARTTRLNISVPVALSERLRKEGGRVNVSRVCVAALERELGVREARPTIDTGQLERLVQRLQSNRERWSERGRRDGERWAVETATRAELRAAGTHPPAAPPDGLSPGGDDTAAGAAPGEAPAGTGLPRSFDPAQALDRWLHADAGVREEDVRYRPKGAPQYPPGVAEGVQRARAQIDLSAYLSGWGAAVAEIWKAVRPALE
jgi:hypothetical protein